ncbi:hypothetical protein [Rhizobium sp. 18065]|uniref:hypothetical protein n=1 Tax=Rhizobium sp. 18065 TaxID=2681411 RepID=UPI00135B791E|nr:hypothetical protein [Rhizobium sp. 18065]
MIKLIMTLYAEILTPAVAGSVIWTSCEILYSIKSNEPSIIFPSIITILFLSSYIVVDHLLIKSDKYYTTNPLGVIFEGIHLFFVALIALSIKENMENTKVILTAYLCIIMIGNLLGVWEVKNNNRFWNFSLVFADIIGITLLLYGCNIGIREHWNIPAGLVTSLAVWLIWAKPRTMHEMIHGMLSK